MTVLPDAFFTELIRDYRPPKHDSSYESVLRQLNLTAEDEAPEPCDWQCYSLALDMTQVEGYRDIRLPEFDGEACTEVLMRSGSRHLVRTPLALFCAVRVQVLDTLNRHSHGDLLVRPSLN